MARVYYYYKSQAGVEIPGSMAYEAEIGFNAACDQLRKNFAGSITPLTKIFPMMDWSMCDVLKAALQAQLTATPTTETGLIFSIEQVIDELGKF